MDPFAVLGATRSFDQDLPALEKRHRDLSRALHPDRHTAGGASERRAALSRAVEVNEAWRTVRCPLTRAEALFRLAGIAVGETNEPKASPSFLMDVMELRETLAEARAKRDRAAVQAMAEDVKRRATEAEQRLARGFAEGPASALAPLLGTLGELRYYRRFLEEAEIDE